MPYFNVLVGVNIILTWFLYIVFVIFFIINGLILHEYTHYYMARILGVRVDKPQFYLSGYLYGKKAGKCIIYEKGKPFWKIFIILILPTIIEGLYFFLIVFFTSFISSKWALLFKIVLSFAFISCLFNVVIKGGDFEQAIFILRERRNIN